MKSAFRHIRFICLSTAVAVAALAGWSSDLPAAEQKPDPDKVAKLSWRGVVVVAGAKDVSQALAAAKESPALILLLTSEASVETLRRDVSDAGMAGQITVRPLARSIPLIDGLASMVILNDANVLRAEAERVLGPRGALIEPGKPVWIKPVPKEHDDWGQYFYNGAATDVSGDTALRPVTGFQWMAGTQNAGKLTQVEPSTGLRIADGIVLHTTGNRLIARDTRSGVPIWERTDIQVDQAQRYAFLADAALGRIWLLPTYIDAEKSRAPGPRYLHMLDLHTGKTLSEFNQGINFAMPDGYKLKHGEQSRANDAQVRLDQGRLLMVTKEELVMVEAATGKKLWSTQSKIGEWWTPILTNGTAYLIEGRRANAAAYTHWPMGLVNSVVAFDAATGQERWRTTPETDGKAIAAYNLTAYKGQLALAVRWDNATVKTDRGYLLTLDQKTGRQLHFTAIGGGDGLGKGHSHWRVMGIGDRWWLNGISTQTTVPIANPSDKSQWKAIVPDLRPVGCTVFRATTEYLIGAATLAELDGSKIHMNTASRTACDIGAFPASGLLFQGENHCWCGPYLFGLNAMNGTHWPVQPKPDRLTKGRATPAAAVATTQDAWPQYMQSPWRGNLNPAPLGTANLKESWRIKTQPSSVHASLRREWDELFMAQSTTVTGVSVAEGVAVFARVQQGEVIALDPATGTEKWRTLIDGRIDSQPTIAGGLVIIGSRSGWVHALNRDSGQFVWKFRAAPSSEMVVANGQLESVWPVSGSVALTDKGALVIAGRHTELDGGLYWTLLDPLTGDIRASGNWAAQQIDTPRKGGGSYARKIRVTRNMPPITDGTHVFLMDFLQTFDGKDMTDYRPKSSAQFGDRVPAWINTREIPLVQPNLSTLAVGLPKTGYNKDSYNGTLSRQFVYQPGSPDFIDMGGGGGLSYGGRGGGSEANVARLRKLDQIKSDGKSQVGAELIWKAEFARELGEIYGLRVTVASADTVLVGLTHDKTKDFRGKNRHILHVLDYADGRQRQELPLPAPPATGGISLAQGRVFVACEDGSVHCFTAR